MARPKKLLWLVYSFLAGALLAGSFPGIGLPWLAWLAPGLVLCLSHQGDGKRAFFSGFLAGLGYWLTGVYWLLLIPFRWYGLAAYLGQSAMGAVYMGGWTWLCWQLWPAKRRGGALGPVSESLPSQWHALSRWQLLEWPLLCAAAWVTAEMTLVRVLTGFPGFLGASQFRWLSLLQISSFTGVYGVSFLVVWLSVSFFCAALSWSVAPRRSGRVLLPLIPPLLCLAGVLAFGHYELSGMSDSPRRLKIALVQPAIAQPAIWDSREETNRFLKLLQLSRAALAEKPNVLVWPETALPRMITRSQFTQDAIVNLLQPYHTWMIFGASDYETQPGLNGPDTVRWFNAAFLINPAGQMAGLYHKRHLVPFGEFMPGARWFPPLARLREAGAGLGSGDRPGFFHTTDPSANGSVLICYEDLFPHEVRGSLQPQTDYLLNLTNDGWFGNSAAQWQHTVNALIRAVELHLPLVRCCNNGITCWIDARGRLHNVYFPGSTDVYQAGYKLIEVPLTGPYSGMHPTFYRHYGDVFGWGCVVLVTIALAKALILYRGSASSSRRQDRGGDGSSPASVRKSRGQGTSRPLP